MASHVVVVDSTARRVKIPTTPGKQLTDVLQEACVKLKYNPASHGLKYKNKQLDLSIPFRLSGLVSGAQLEIVQVARSAGVVTVALQLPESEANQVPGGRLIDKFPSTTTLWQVLRKFEAGAAGDGGSSKFNFTARGIPSSTTGAGSLLYEQPLLQISNRELANFTDLQKTLMQLGLNTGSIVIRMRLAATQKPLQDALQEHQAYFDSLEDTSTGPQAQQSTRSDPPQSSSIPSGVQEERPPDQQTTDTAAAAPLSVSNEGVAPLNEESDAAHPSHSSVSESTTSPRARPVSVYRPPTSATPSAAIDQGNESDYTPTVEHAQAHQRMLNDASRNRRLKTDAELAAQVQEQDEKLAAVTEVTIRVKFPDQLTLETPFNQSNTGNTLYDWVRSELATQFQNEGFVLGVPGGLQSKMQIIPNSDARLIKDLRLRGRVLMVFQWDEKTASPAAGGSKTVLKPERVKEAQVLKAPDQPTHNSGPEDQGVKVNLGKGDGDEGSSGDSKAGGKVPKWLKFGKK